MAKNKPILYYTLIRDWHVGGFDVMAVTTERRKHWGAGEISHLYGSREATGMNTHCNANQVVGKFDTLEAAQAVVGKVKRVRDGHAEILSIMNTARTLAERAERDAIEDVVAGREPPPPPMPYDLMNKAAGVPPGARLKIARGLA